MLKIVYENQFKKDFKLIIKRGYNVSKFEKVLEILVSQAQIPLIYKDHSLNGKYNEYRELHIESDWLLIYKINNNELKLVLTRTGTHSDLF